MKYLIIFLLIFADKSCSESKIEEDNISIVYTTSSRGAYKQFIINNKTISKINKRGGKANSHTYNENDWNKIIETLKTIDIENIPNLESPSKKFQFDGAPLTHLKVIYNNTTYQTQPFDGGNPHKAIETLIKEILSITENIE